MKGFVLDWPSEQRERVPGNFPKAFVKRLRVTVELRGDLNGNEL
jgi:hypothetical protein